MMGTMLARAPCLTLRKLARAMLMWTLNSNPPGPATTVMAMRCLSLFDVVFVKTLASHDLGAAWASHI
jgi:hypothetical protein